MDNLSLLEQIITAPQPFEVGGKPPVPNPAEIKKDQVETETPHVKATPNEAKPAMEKKEPQVNRQSSFKEWFWTQPPEGEPLFALTRDALGITGSESIKDSNLVAEIASAAATLLQSDDERKVFEFLRKKLTATPANIGSPLRYLRRVLLFELREQKEKYQKERG